MIQHETRETVRFAPSAEYAGKPKQKSRLEANMFVIENAAELNGGYRLFRIRGLDPESDDYPKNAQNIVNTISRKNSVPAIIYYKDDIAHLAQPTDCTEPPDKMPLVRTMVYFEPIPETFPLRFDAITPETEPLCVRFLQFALQTPLIESTNLWRPGAGKPFFHKQPDFETDLSSKVLIYKGFTFRVVAFENGQLCLCVDTTRKYVARSFLPPDLTREDFRSLKGSRCVYHFGHKWYEIRLEGFHDLNVSETTFKVGTEHTPLLPYILKKNEKPLPPELLKVPDDCAVVTYRNFEGKTHHVPTALCRLTYDTESPEVKPLHRKTIRPPHQRRREILKVVDNYLRNLSFNGGKIQLSRYMLPVQRKFFQVPDMEFGNNEKLSVRGTKDARHTSLQQLGAERLGMLYDAEAGMWASGRLDRQYVIMPLSMAESYGATFLEELKEGLETLYPDSKPYTPEMITYNDKVPKTVHQIGRQILNAVGSEHRRSGYGLVIIPHTQNRKPREQDKLAHLVIRELRERDIYASVIHTTVQESSYKLRKDINGRSNWARANGEDVKKRLIGYLRNVALNKILLLNRCWPFVLATPLNAEIVVGIDVKNHTAGFTFIRDGGRMLRFVSDTSEQKEKLRDDQVEKIVVDTLREELDSKDEIVKSIVFHRDGQVYEPEKRGILKAIGKLKAENLLSDNLQWSIVEIPKTSPVRFRLFDVNLKETGRQLVENPEIGTFVKKSENEGYVCTTGRPFYHPGCTRPLLIRLVDGNMTFENVMEDIYALSHLAWTKPDDCSRVPLSIRMTDIHLEEVGGEYDEDTLRYTEDEKEVVV